MPLSAGAVTSFTATPSYGQGSALLTWTLDPSCQDVEVHVCRSDTGLPPWTDLSLDDSPVGSGQYLDRQLPQSGSKISTIHYQLVLRRGSDIAVSASLAFYEPTSFRDFGMLRRSLWEEAMQARHKGGVLMLHYVPLRRGERNPNFDEASGQQLCCTDAQGFGQPFLGGFTKPVGTWVRLGREVRKQSTDETGNNIEVIELDARLLAFPRPEREHLLVQPDTDERYVIGEVTASYKYRGRWPIAYATSLLPLRKRGDARYLVPIPDNLEDLIYFDD